MRGCFGNGRYLHSLLQQGHSSVLTYLLVASHGMDELRFQRNTVSYSSNLPDSFLSVLFNSTGSSFRSAFFFSRLFDVVYIKRSFSKSTYTYVYVYNETLKNSSSC